MTASFDVVAVVAAAADAAADARPKLESSRHCSRETCNSVDDSSFRVKENCFCHLLERENPPQSCPWSIPTHFADESSRRPWLMLQREKERQKIMMEEIRTKRRKE